MINESDVVNDEIMVAKFAVKNSWVEGKTFWYSAVLCGKLDCYESSWRF